MPYKDPEIRKLVQVYNQMKQRCYKETHPNYHQYGGRGIYVTWSWMDSFSNFMKDMGPRPAGYTLERIDNNGPYSPTNCKWAPTKEQHRNTRQCLLDAEKVSLIRAMWEARNPATTKQYFYEVIGEVFAVKPSTIDRAVHLKTWS